MKASVESALDAGRIRFARLSWFRAFTYTRTNHFFTWLPTTMSMFETRLFKNGYERCVNWRSDTRRCRRVQRSRGVFNLGSRRVLRVLSRPRTGKPNGKPCR